MSWSKHLTLGAAAVRADDRRGIAQEDPPRRRLRRAWSRRNPRRPPPRKPPAPKPRRCRRPQPRSERADGGARAGLDARSATPTPAAAAPGDGGPPRRFPSKSRRSRSRSRVPSSPPLETALSTDPHPTLSPETLLSDRRRPRSDTPKLSTTGGWPTDIPRCTPARRDAAVAKLRRRLAIEGDLAGTAIRRRRPQMGCRLTAAVKHFQGRMGLRQTGAVAGATLKAINVPAESAPPGTRRQRGAAVQRACRVRAALCRGQPAVDLGRGDRGRAGRASLRRDRRRSRSSLAGDLRAYLRSSI